MNWTDDFYSIVEIVGRTSAVYFFLIIGILLFGKKELAQLSILDLVFILLISNSVQNAMVGESNSLWGGLISATVLFALNFILKKAAYLNPKLDKLLEGVPVMLVYRGKVIKSNLDRETVTMGELEAAAREHGVDSINDIKIAMLENDGNISIVTFDKETISHYKRKHKVPARVGKGG